MKELYGGQDCLYNISSKLDKLIKRVKQIDAICPFAA